MPYHKLHLRADSANGTHTKFTVFMNGANCGQLTMNEEEATFFHDVVLRSTWPILSGEKDAVWTSGRWIKVKEV